MTNSKKLQLAILERLSAVIEPVTGVDVLRMKPVDDLIVESNGQVICTFHPSSHLRPIVLYLVLKIEEAIAGVKEVKRQAITVKDYVEAETLTKLINQEVDEK